MNNTLHKYLDIFVIVYLDNILVYSTSKEEHVKHIKLVLEKIKKYNLLLKLEKYKFHKSQVKFLGYIIRTHSIKIDQAKVIVVLE
jgi:hypothetical protein